MFFFYIFCFFVAFDAPLHASRLGSLMESQNHWLPRFFTLKVVFFQSYFLLFYWLDQGFRCRTHVSRGFFNFISQMKNLFCFEENINFDLINGIINIQLHWKRNFLRYRKIPQTVPRTGSYFCSFFWAMQPKLSNFRIPSGVFLKQCAIVCRFKRLFAINSVLIFNLFVA